MMKLTQTVRRQIVLAHFQDMLRLIAYPHIVLELNERHANGGEDCVHIYLRGKEHPRTTTYVIEADSELGLYVDTVKALKQYL